MRPVPRVPDGPVQPLRRRLVFRHTAGRRAFADYVTIHEDFAFALPDGMSDDMGALMEPLSVGIWACRKAGVTAGDRVLVTGAGPIGLLAMQVAKAFGATDVAISDVNEL